MSTPEEPIVVSSVTVVLEENTVAVTRLGGPLILNAPGPQGPVGPQGPAGAPGGSAFEHVQDVPAATWPVNHNLGRRAHVTILDPDGTEVEADIIHSSANSVVITFPTPHTGTVIVS